MDGSQAPTPETNSEQKAASGIPVTHRNYRYRLKLRPSQHLALARICEMQRLLFNAALQARVESYGKAGLSMTYVDQCRDLTQIRADDPKGYGSLPVSLCRGTLKRLDLAFQAFFRRVKAGQTPGFPRFKPRSRWDSFSMTEMAGLVLKGAGESRGSLLQLKGVPGLIRVRLHRPLPAGARARAAIFRRAAGGQWDVCLLLEVPLTSAEAWTPVELDKRGEIGLDVGIESFLTTSDGDSVPAISPGKQKSKRQARLQRSLARKKRGSRRRAAVKRQLARLSETIANRRKDHAHVIARSLVRRYRTIAVEDLSIGNMSRSAKGTTEEPGTNVQQKAGLNRAILDQGWGGFIFKLTYKAESAGGSVVKGKPHGTSQDCSGCGQRVEKTLDQRWHRCPHCGLELHRDHNAARNILLRAQRRGKTPPRLQPAASVPPVPRESRNPTAHIDGVSAQARRRQ